MIIRNVLGFGALALALGACSSASTDTPAAADAGTKPIDSGAAADSAVSHACPTSAHKTIVVVGDSISDQGSGETLASQEPFYRTLLVKNDDAKYPDWKGSDLSTCWKIDPTANVVKVSVGGAIATEKVGKQSVLLDQVKSLPASLPGPVLVIGTIGGNDALAGLADVLIGTAEQQKADLDGFIKGFGDAMTELTRTDRFGAGVKVDVLMTNIFDPSGGTGNFVYTPEKINCPGSFSLWPAGKPTDPVLNAWDTAMQAEAAKYPGVKLLDLHAQFKSHDVNQAADANWFYDDCIHPNSAGHEHIRELFWGGISAL